MSKEKPIEIEKRIARKFWEAVSKYLYELKKSGYDSTVIEQEFDKLVNLQK